MRSRVLAFVVLMAICVSSYADLQVTNAWIRQPPTDDSPAVAYVDLQSDHRLFWNGATTIAANHVGLHEMNFVNGVATMREIPGFILEPNHLVSFEHVGFHLMLEELKYPLHEGDTVWVTLHFAAEGGKGVTAVTPFKVKPVNTVPDE